MGFELRIGALDELRLTVDVPCLPLRPGEVTSERW
jgi:hypothetical protein